MRGGHVPGQRYLGLSPVVNPNAFGNFVFMPESPSNPPSPENALTVILNAALEGDEAAGRRMWEAVYEDLRTMARTAVSRESASADLEATQVVNEVFLRLHGSPPSAWDGRRHFFGAAVRAMQQFLVDHGRRRSALKRGGTSNPVLLSVLAGELADYDTATSSAAEGLIPALDRLAEIDCQAAEVARLRWLIGLTSEQVASILSCSVRKVQLDWRFAKAYLQRELTEIEE
ncbi:MAG: RNA polymerase subunit sigma [Phycisphaera sp.]|nr:RNA polymerase subunit sigma [Phycisphaera sp.]